MVQVLDGAAQQGRCGGVGGMARAESWLAADLTSGRPQPWNRMGGGGGRRPYASSLRDPTWSAVARVRVALHPPLAFSPDSGGAMPICWLCAPGRLIQRQLRVVWTPVRDGDLTSVLQFRSCSTPGSTGMGRTLIRRVATESLHEGSFLQIWWLTLTVRSNY